MENHNSRVKRIDEDHFVNDGENIILDECKGPQAEKGALLERQYGQSLYEQWICEVLQNFYDFVNLHFYNFWVLHEQTFCFSQQIKWKPFIIFVGALNFLEQVCITVLHFAMTGTYDQKGIITK